MVGLLKWTSAHPHSHPSSMSLLPSLSSKIAIYMRKLREIARTESAYTASASVYIVYRISSANVSASVSVLHACVFVRVCVCVCLIALYACMPTRAAI